MFISGIFSRWSFKVCGGQNSDRICVSPRGNIAAFTHEAGRKTNGDGFFFRNFPGTVLAVGDGLSGIPAGEIANRISLQTLQRHTRLNTPLPSVFRRANARILKTAARMGKPAKGMSTTLVAARVVKDRAGIASCGDSRIFLIEENEKVSLLTRDQNDAFDRYQAEYLFEPVVFPMEDPAEYYEMSRKRRNNPLFKCLGMKDPVIFTLEKDVVLRKGSRLLLCTDGLYRYLPYPSFIEILARGESPANTVDKLVKKALANMASSGDNIAVVLYEYCP